MSNRPKDDAVYAWALCRVVKGVPAWREAVRSGDVYTKRRSAVESAKDYDLRAVVKVRVTLADDARKIGGAE